MQQMFFSYYQGKSILLFFNNLWASTLVAFSKHLQRPFIMKNLFWVKALPESEWMYDQLHLLEHTLWNMAPFQTFQSSTLLLKFYFMF